MTYPDLDKYLDQALPHLRKKSTLGARLRNIISPTEDLRAEAAQLATNDLIDNLKAIAKCTQLHILAQTIPWHFNIYKLNNVILDVLYHMLQQEEDRQYALEKEYNPEKYGLTLIITFTPENALLKPLAKSNEIMEQINAYLSTASRERYLSEPKWWPSRTDIDETFRYP
jgi:hypothetical protein